jgi:hypothetical protein
MVKASYSKTTLFKVLVLLGIGYMTPSVLAAPSVWGGIREWCVQKLCPKRFVVPGGRRSFQKVEGLKKPQLSELLLKEASSSFSSEPLVEKKVVFSEQSLMSPQKVGRSEFQEKFLKGERRGSSSKKKSSSKKRRAAMRRERAEKNLKKLISSETLQSTYLGEMGSWLTRYQEWDAKGYLKNYNYALPLVEKVRSYTEDFLRMSDQSEEGMDLFLKIMEEMYWGLFHSFSFHKDLQKMVSDSLLQQVLDKLPESHGHFRMILELRLEQRRICTFF